MNHSNYALTSPHNVNYLFVLKKPQLIANSQIHFDQTNAFFIADQEAKLHPMTYYYIQYAILDHKKALIKLIQATPLSTIGSQWNSQIFLKHMNSFQGTLKQPVSDNQFMKQTLEHGELKVNDEGWIYVKAYQSGFRKKLKLVNTLRPIPLLKGSKVDFFLRKYAQTEGPKVKISRIQFRPIKLAGILKMINGRLFFQPRHTDYERMLPLSVPQPLMQIIYECLPHYKGSLPYNIFKRYDGDENVINKKLASYVLQGRFIDWPLKFSHPVLQIQRIQLMNCSNLKKATLYELGIPMLEYDEEQHQLSNQIVQNFKPQGITDRHTITQRCYSFDCQGGSCFDDAFSFVRTERGYLVGVHISDVPELIKHKPYLLKKALCRDQTIYIKNYYRSMFPQQLRNIMSLQEDKFRLAFSLFFQITSSGEIIYDSVRLKESKIKVVQNLTHGQPIQNKEDRQLVKDLSKSLQKCKQLSNLMLFDDVQTATLTNQLLFLSALIPMNTFHHNVKQLPSVIQAIQSKVEEYCIKAKKLIEYQKKGIKDLQKDQKEESNIKEDRIMKTDQVKTSPNTEENIEQKNFQNATKVTLPDVKSMSSSMSSVEQQLSFSYEDSLGSSKKQKIYQSPNKIQSSQKNQFFRKVTPKQGSAAECFRFLDKLFKAAGMQIDFSHPKNIELAFRDCERKYKDKISEIYFRTKLIMSRQHFEVISRLYNEGQLTKFQLNNTIYQQPSTQKRKVSQSDSGQIKQVEVQKVEVSIPLIPKKVEQNQQKQPVQLIQKTTQGNKQEKIQNKAQKIEKQNKTQEQNELSIIINALQLILEKGFYLHASLSEKEIIYILDTLKKLVKEKQIKVFQQSSLEREQNFNSEIIKSLEHKNHIYELTKSFLKWNTPIRSGSSLKALIFMKEHRWIFQGYLQPCISIQQQQNISNIKQKIAKMIKKRDQQQDVHLNNRIKEANRQLGKIDFLFILRQQPDKIWDFITITSPSQKVQFVYHEHIEEVEVDNPQKNVIYYKKVRGKFKGIFDFPIKLKVILEKD